ncbi:MAG: TonB-dependent receptor [Deferribacteres bacterium]|nr:TonB-dependent receptor [candidate division KSB1 bacterium]MCB9503259.1 TonB-dependent receptor [Deferribacteres bacterium]
MRRKYALVLMIYFMILVLFLQFNTVFSATTGKLSGTVTDQETGEPLPGANIIVVGTNLGAASNAQGLYTILNIPPGKYTILFRFIGYHEVRVENVEINVDFTSHLDYALTPSTLEMDEVVVLADRTPLVRNDLTNTQVAVTSETIEALPIDQLNQIIRLQPGITTDNSGEIHIRGGRSNEIATQINGISVANPFDNSQAVGIATNAVQEVSVSAGTFSAEYGNALSGVINYVTKEGGNNINATLRAWSGDHATNRKDLFFGIDEFDPLNEQRIEGTVGGPIPGTNKKAKFFLSAVTQKDKGWIYGIDVYKPTDILVIDGDSLVFDPYGDGVPSGNGDIVPMMSKNAWNATAKLSYEIMPRLKLSYDLVFDYTKLPGSGQFRNFRFNPDGRRFLYKKNISHSIGLTHVLNDNSFYTLKFAGNFTSANNRVFDDPFDERYVASYEGNVNNNLFPQTDYLAGGHNLDRDEDESASYIGKLDFVSQLTPIHELRFGGDYVRHELQRESYTLLHTDISGVSLPIIPYPELNPEFTEYQYYKNKPVQAAAYFLDKMELSKSFILNVGFRYEYFNAKALYNPDLIGTVDSGVAENLVAAEAKHMLAPRVSLSFPITDQGIIRFSYGHFFQNPPLEQIYRNPRFEDLDFISTPSFGNPNLEPEKSIQYELGLQQALTEDLKFDLTAYYKDVSNLIQSRRLVAGEAAASKEFNVITNISYANVKGFTISLLKRPSGNGMLSGSIDYTYQLAEGAFEDPLDFFLDVRSDRETEQTFVPLSHDRTNTLNSVLTLASAKKWSASGIASFWSGTPYTPSLPANLSRVEFENNSARRPLNFNVDLRFEKFFKLNALKYSIFLQINNVLDLDNERIIHTSTGRSLNSLEEVNNPTRFDVLRSQMSSNPALFFPEKFLDNYYQREDWLSEPREIRLGMSFSLN